MRLSAVLVVIASLFFCHFASSAFAAEETTVTSKDQRIQIQIPQGYEQTTPPKPDIILEATNQTAGTTVLVLSESQQDFASLADYGDIVVKSMLGRLTDGQTNAAEKLQIAGQPAIRFEITGISSNGLRMGFLLTIIQSETRFNQVIGSCLRAQFAEQKEELGKISTTLREIPAKPAR